MEPWNWRLSGGYFVMVWHSLVSMYYGGIHRGILIIVGPVFGVDQWDQKRDRHKW